MNSLIVGGHGFIGSHVAEKLAATGLNATVYGRPSRLSVDHRVQGVTYVEAELRDTEQLRACLRGSPVVIHLAGTSIPESSVDNPFLDLEVNVGDTLRLLEACRVANTQRLVYLSSGGTVYGVARSVPIGEDHPTDPISAYGVNKLAAEKYIAMYHHLYGLDYAILRASNAYGEYQNLRKRQGIIGVFLHRIARGEEISVWGTGEVARDYVYAGDVADAIIRAACVPLSHRVFNVGSGQSTTVNDLLARMHGVTCREVKVSYQPGRTLDVPVNVLDTTRAQEELDWKPSVSLSEGISRTWEWIMRTTQYHD